MIKLRFHILFVLFVAIVACEKVVTIDVDESDPLMVVEGKLKDRDGESVIYLSKSGSLYGSSEFEKISGALVQVTDENGNVFTFVENTSEPGTYRDSGFVLVPSTKYSLFTEIEGKIISAEGYTNSKPKIDSMSYLKLSYGGEKDTFYQFSYHSVDPPGEVNKYYVRVWINGDLIDGIYYLGNDDFIDGQYYEAPFIGLAGRPKDTISIEVISMDEKVYRYYYQMANNADQSPFSAAPANPETNLVGEGTVGYFGVFTTDTMTLILP